MISQTLTLPMTTLRGTFCCVVRMPSGKFVGERHYGKPDFVKSIGNARLFRTREAAYTERDELESLGLGTGSVEGLHVDMTFPAGW